MNNSVKNEKEIHFKNFDMIWTNYVNLLPINRIEFDIYMKIIDKIRNNNFDFTEEKYIFLNLIEMISVTLYNFKKYNILPRGTKYDKKKWYDDDTDLQCCYYVRKYVE